LIIDGERPTRRMLRLALEQERYNVIEAANGQLGLEMAAAKRPDVIIFDLDLPDIEGVVLLRRLREWNQEPVMVISERAQVSDKVRALDSGADDYLTKPFDVAELLARLRVLQRSQRGIPDGPLLVEGDLVINLSTHEVTLRGDKLSFTPIEEALLYLLIRYLGKVVTRKHLMRCIWGGYEEDRTRELQVYIANLRAKLGACGAELLIRTEGSLGYRLSTASSPEGACVPMPA
jgi:two-component system, OmpR family, KDP operon response regulator KdpE